MHIKAGRWKPSRTEPSHIQNVSLCFQGKLLQEGRTRHAASEVDATRGLHGGHLHIENRHMVTMLLLASSLAPPSCCFPPFSSSTVCL